MARRVDPVRVVEMLLIGPLQPLGRNGVPSGIVKQPVDSPVRLATTGFEGDEQGDTKHHGGPEKAVHHYPLEHYARWREEIGRHPLLERGGAFGENLSVGGLKEAEVAIGDCFRLGSAVVEVSQGRQPCFRLNLRMGVADMALRMQRSGRTGWYYRVIEEGHVAPGDTLELIDRKSPAWTIERLWRVLYIDVLDHESLHEIVSLSHLPERWRRVASKRLETGRVEDWKQRLEGG